MLRARCKGYYPYLCETCVELGEHDLAISGAQVGRISRFRALSTSATVFPDAVYFENYKMKFSILLE